MADGVRTLEQLRDEWLRGARRDVFLGDADANAIDGTDVADTILGRRGDDTLTGRGGGDQLFGGAGDDDLRGNGGDDVLYGRAGADDLAGGHEDDLLDGGHGRDTLDGGIGADTLVGGNGNDRLVGAADVARDVFVFDRDDGNDRIRGFDALRDVVQVEGDYTVTLDPLSGAALVVTGATTVRIAGVGTTPLLIDRVGINDAPVVAAIDAGEVDEDFGTVTVDLLAGQRDAEGDALRIASADIVLRDATGTVVAAGDPRFVALGGAVTGDTLQFDTAGFDKLAAGTVLTVEVTYGVTDRPGADGEVTANVAVVDIAGTNDAPTLEDGTLLVADDGVATLDLAALGADVDLDDDGGTLVYTLEDATPGASITGTRLGVDGNLLAGDIAPHGTAEVTIGIVATDRHGATASGDVTVTVFSPNADPVATDDDVAASATRTTTIRIADLLGNDTDADGDTLTIEQLDLAGLKGQLIDNGDGTLTYDPDGAFDALPLGGTGTDSFRYTVADGFGGTDTATVDLAVANKLDSFTGSTVRYEHQFPNRDTVNSAQTIAVDDDGTTFAYRAGSGVSAFVTIDDDQIILSTTAASIGFSQPLPKPPGFHGFTVEDVSDMLGDIVGVTAASDSVAFDAGRVTFTDDSVTFELGGFTLNRDERVVLDVEFA